MLVAHYINGREKDKCSSFGFLVSKSLPQSIELQCDDRKHALELTSPVVV